MNPSSLNAYAALTEAKEQSTALRSERERIRNQILDATGQSPTDEQIDAELLRRQASGG
jgi:hypothetical protein